VLERSPLTIALLAAGNPSRTRVTQHRIVDNRQTSPGKKLKPMTQVILNQILEQLKTLEVEELRQLNQVIQKRLADKEEAAQRSTFHEALLASGLVKQIKQPAYRQQTKQRLIQVQGKPVSKTIIEERR